MTKCPLAQAETEKFRCGLANTLRIWLHAVWKPTQRKEAARRLVKMGLAPYAS